MNGGAHRINGAGDNLCVEDQVTAAGRVTDTMEEVSTDAARGSRWHRSSAQQADERRRLMQLVESIQEEDGGTEGSQADRTSGRKDQNSMP